MKISLLLPVAALLVFAACQKEDSGLPGAPPKDSNAVTPTPPPAGFTFPKTFNTNGSATVAFNVWIDGQDVTNRFQPSYFFTDQPGPDLLKTASIRLIDKSTLEVVDGTGQNPSQKYGYYFYRDTLFISLTNLYPAPVAVGNYYGFTLSRSDLMVSGEKHQGFRERILNRGGLATTYQKVTDYYIKQTQRLSKIDTVAIRNFWYNFY